MSNAMRRAPWRALGEATREIPQAQPRKTTQAKLEATCCLLREAYAQAGAAFAEAAHGAAQRQTLAGIAAECLEQFRRRSRIGTVLSVGPAWRERAFSPLARAQVKRLLQEALNNADRHAAASRVEVTLDAEDGRATVRIEDDGRGFMLSRVLRQLLRPSYPRHGLAAMRDCARAIGATFEVSSAPGRGTRITVRMPASASRRQKSM